MSIVGDGAARSCWGRLGALVLLLTASAAAAPAEKPRLTTPADLARCVERWGPEPCLEALHEYVEARPDQAFEAARLATKIFAHWAAMPLFERALTDRADSARCKDDRLVLAVTSALAQPNDVDSGRLVASAAGVLRNRCWKELRDPLARQLDKDARGILVRNVCHVFIEKTFAEKSATPAACWPETRLAQRRPGAPTWEALDPRRLALEGSASVYSGPDGRRVTLAKVAGKPYYLIKFQGFRGPWNGKVVIHRRDAAGSGHDYWTSIGGRRYVGLIVRKPASSDAFWEVHPFGASGAWRVTFDAAASQAAKPQNLLAELSR